MLVNEYRVGQDELKSQSVFVFTRQGDWEDPLGLNTRCIPQWQKVVAEGSFILKPIIILLLIIYYFEGHWNTVLHNGIQKTM